MTSRETQVRQQARLDVLGLVLASGGIAALIYGLGRVATGGASHSPVPLAAVVAGIGLVASFCIHALRAPRPLIDIRLFARRGFAAAALTNLVLGMALFGVSLLLAHAFGVTFWLALALTAAAVVPALLLPGGRARPAPRPAGPARS